MAFIKAAVAALVIMSAGLVSAAEQVPSPFQSSFRAACDTGDEKSCTQLVVDLFFVAEKLDARKADLQPGLLWKALNLQQACQNGSPTACAVSSASAIAPESLNGAAIDNEIDRIDENPAAKQATRDRFFEVFMKACDQESAVGCAIAGIIKQSGNASPTEAERGAYLVDKAIRLASPLCDGGDMRVCDLIAIYYQKSDAGRASDYYWRGHGGECGSPTMCFDAGKKYRAIAAKIGKSRNIFLAHLFFTKACDGGEMRACTNLGLIYAGGSYAGGGLGVPANSLAIPPNNVRARELLSKACDGGDRLGCFDLGLSYLLEQELKPDARSVALFGKACVDPVYRRACYVVGEAYLAGEGVPRDTVRAKEFFRKSCADNDQACRTQVDRTGRAKNISIDQIMGQIWH